MNPTVRQSHQLLEPFFLIQYCLDLKTRQCQWVSEIDCPDGTIKRENSICFKPRKVFLNTLAFQVTLVKVNAQFLELLSGMNLNF